MTPQQKLEQFVQRVYLTRYNRYLDDLTDEDGLAEIDKVIDWTNMLLDELEQELDNEGQPVDWSFARENNKEIGTIASSTQTFNLPSGVLRLVVDENRPLTITQDGSTVSTWEVVNPNQITKRTDATISDRVTVVNGVIIFSRALEDYEIGGTVKADVINELTRMVESPINVDVLSEVKPQQLLVLGVAKNATLPDIVQGGLSPSFVQKYGDLLEQVKAQNGASSTSDELVTDDLSSIGGVF